MLTYLSLFLKASVDDLFELLDLFFADAPELVPELSVLLDELLDHVHLLGKLIELLVCQSFSIGEP